MLWLLPALLLWWVNGIPSAAADNVVLEDKNLYKANPLYVDLDLNPADSADDANFVVMQEGSVILYAEPGMSMDVAQGGTLYTLYQPGSEARNIAPGTPVAFVDKAGQKAFFFIPTRVTSQSDRIVFDCNPEETEPERLFAKAGISIQKTIPFSRAITWSDASNNLTFSGVLEGDFYVDVS